MMTLMFDMLLINYRRLISSWSSSSASAHSCGATMCKHWAPICSSPSTYIEAAAMKRSNEPVDRDANSRSRSPGLSRADRERAARGGRSLRIDDDGFWRFENPKVWVRLRWLSGEAIEGRISACSLTELFGTVCCSSPNIMTGCQITCI